MMREGETGLSEARFRALAQAYGGEIARWPGAVQAQARAMAERAELSAVLAEARAVDAALDRFALAPPAPALAARILRETGRGHALRLAIRRALIGAGLLGVGLAGGLAGAAAVMIAVPPPALTGEDGTTVFGMLAPDLAAADLNRPGASPRDPAPAMEREP
ncbi:hypothetical protein BJF92_21215 [Rhizobium rhizosphaerae]|uniref:Uncharacterized protein n=1 Tax=Xaviernesmea rhizosphaerae TaxID=1672749 RepID=A0A1Q9ANN2_9HYPH|nr:hypothetical protein [Xaviernesmea rhizosphaerae]OLP57030.1 hypothetical protein BJF92_21215 [Xaviernesmea rhizosphaerae]OQP87124.1 hypothetical protein BTR14_06775 [Xaviernesmea rhizosphaerae]